MSSFIRRFFYKWKMSRRGMLNPERKVNHRGAKLKRSLDRNPLIGMFMLLILMAVSVWSMMERVDFKDVPRMVENQTASATIYAAVPFSYVDRDATQKLHNEVLKRIPMFFRVSKENMQGLKDRLSQMVEDRKKLGEKDLSFYHTLAEKVMTWAYRGLISPADRELYYGQEYRVIDPLDRIPAEALQIKDAYLPSEAASEITDDLLRSFRNRAERVKKEQELTGMIEALLTPHVMYFDKKYTEETRKNMLKAAGVIHHEIPRGQMILQKNTIVTASDLERLAAYSAQLERTRQEQREQVNWVRLSQSLCIAFLLVLFTGIYISHIHPEIVRSSGKIWALGLIILVAILLNIFSVKLFAYAGEIFSIPPKLWYLSLPLGFAPIVIGALIGVRTALFSGLFISLVAAFSGVSQFNMVVFGMVVSALSSYMIRPCRNYRSLFLTGFLTLSIVSMTLGIVFCWCDGTLDSLMTWLFILPVAVGIGTIVLVQFALILLESWFDLPTRMSLNLYSDYNHPLLKEMQLKAPGTYHHSLIVSLLAESAAEAIGADPVCARVSALFHDVGKLSHPEYFTENSNGEDKHKDLSPKFSAMVITNHIREGMELARKYKLKRPIREAIEQHHGTDLVYYFYKQAKDSGECISEHDFRYPGPCPRRKETAILSLADACEAASRSLEKPTHARICELVNTIFQKRLRDGQLDECSMTFRELSVIRESFTKTLTSMLHARVAYPKEEDLLDENDLFVDAERKAASTQTP